MDLQKIITDLQSAGLTQAEIAAACQCSQSAISDLSKPASTRNPTMRLALALGQLHKRNARRIRATEKRRIGAGA